MNQDQLMWITVIDSQGRVVSKKLLGQLPSGKHSVLIQRDGLSEGLYFFKLNNSRAEGWSGRLLIQD